MANPLLAPMLRWFSRLRFPHLFLLTAGLFLVDAIVLDPIPFIDELLLGLGSLLLANLMSRKPRPSAPVEGESGRR
jgi:hypothetical protein